MIKEMWGSFSNYSGPYSDLPQFYISVTSQKSMELLLNYSGASSNTIRPIIVKWIVIQNWRTSGLVKKKTQQPHKKIVYSLNKEQ